MKLFDKTGQFAVISSFYALSMLEYKMKIHSHDRYEVMYVTRGDCHIIADNHSFSMHEHQFILLTRNLPHLLYVKKDSPCSLLNIEFCFSNDKNAIDIRELCEISPSFSHMIKETEVPYVVSSDHHQLEYALKDLITHLEEINISSVNARRPFPYTADQNYMTRLLFIRVMLELSQCVTEKQNLPGNTYVKKACAFIAEHFTEEISISDVARYVGISRSYLCSLFSKQHMCSINDYINKERINLAQFLLKSSSFSVTDIAFRCGFNSRQHFRTTFYKYTGINPTEYRSLNNKALNASTGSGKRFLENGNTKSSLLDGDYTLS